MNISSVVPSIVNTILSTPGQIRIALSGGSTPGPIYRALAEQKNIDWERVTIYQVDERYVPHDHPKSNTRLIHETLVEPAGLSPKRFVPFDTSLPIAECVADYEEKLFQLPAPLFHLTLLGMGPDGHTASLFPGDPVLEEKENRVAHTTTDHFDIYDRLTLTLPAIKQSERLLLLISGEEKITLLEKLQAEATPNPDYPISYLLEHPGFEIWHG